MTIERGFCQNKEHLAALRAYGLPDKLMYLDGRGVENLDACIASFRDRPGTLLIAPDLRVFGKSSKAIEATMARLEPEMQNLTEAQYAMLRQHVGTTKREPHRRKHTEAGWEAKEASLFNPTANALRRRGLLDFRGFDGKTAGGWFITKAGRKAIIS